MVQEVNPVDEGEDAAMRRELEASAARHRSQSELDAAAAAAITSGWCLSKEIARSAG